MLIEVIFIIAILWVTWWYLRKPSDIPPGPWGFPLIGSIPLSLTNFNERIDELRLKHGDVFSWRIGTSLLVFLCDFNIIKEAFNSQLFVNRPKMGLLSLLGEPHLGIIATNDFHWHHIRRFTLRHLRDLGMGKSRLVSDIQFEALELVNEMKKQAGKAAPIPDAMAPAVINVLWQMIASKRYGMFDAKVNEYKRQQSEIQNSITFLMMLDIFPWLSYVVPKPLLNWMTAKDLHFKVAKMMKQYFMEHINEHIENLDENNPNDFIDDYLTEMNKQKSEPNSTMSVDDLANCIADLFSAGIETTSATLNWSIVYLAKYPHIQDRLQKELDNVLPNKIAATQQDKQRLPYTESFIAEVLRITSLTLLGLPHSPSTDVKFQGYTIPKGAIIFSTVKNIHFSSTYFESPSEFRPERFLNSDGQFESPKEGLFPFGTGKRQCIGESLARMQIFLFLTTMVQHLNFAAPPNKQIDDTPLASLLFCLPNVEQDIFITVRP